MAKDSNKNPTIESNPHHRKKKPLIIIMTVLAILLMLGSIALLYKNRKIIANRYSKSPDFDIDSVLLKVLLKENEYVTKEIRIMNTAQEEIEFAITTNLPDIIKFESRKISLKPGQTRIMDINFTSFDEGQNIVQQPGVYVGKLSVKSQNLQKELLTVVEIESKDTLFDLNLNPAALDRKAKQGSEIPIEVKVFNLQGIDIGNVDVDYSIKDINSNSITTESENVIVKNHASYFKTISIPKSLNPGSYVFTAKAKFGDSIGTSSYVFEVEGPEKIASFYDFCRNSALCIGLSFTSVLLFLAILAYAYFFFGAFIYEKINGLSAMRRKASDLDSILRQEVSRQRKRMHEMKQKFEEEEKSLEREREEELKKIEEERNWIRKQKKGEKQKFWEEKKFLEYKREEERKRIEEERNKIRKQKDEERQKFEEEKKGIEIEKDFIRKQEEQKSREQRALLKQKTEDYKKRKALEELKKKEEERQKFEEEKKALVRQKEEELKRIELERNRIIKQKEEERQKFEEEKKALEFKREEERKKIEEERNWIKKQKEEERQKFWDEKKRIQIEKDFIRKQEGQKSREQMVLLNQKTEDYKKRKALEELKKKEEERQKFEDEKKALVRQKEEELKRIELERNRIIKQKEEERQKFEDEKKRIQIEKEFVRKQEEQKSREQRALLKQKTEDYKKRKALEELKKKEEEKQNAKLKKDRRKEELEELAAKVKETGTQIASLTNELGKLQQQKNILWEKDTKIRQNALDIEDAIKKKVDEISSIDEERSASESKVISELKESRSKLTMEGKQKAAKLKEFEKNATARRQELLKGLKIELSAMDKENRKKAGQVRTKEIEAMLRKEKGSFRQELSAAQNETKNRISQLQLELKILPKDFSRKKREAEKTLIAFNVQKKQVHSAIRAFKKESDDNLKKFEAANSRMVQLRKERLELSNELSQRRQEEEKNRGFFSKLFGSKKDTMLDEIEEEKLIDASEDLKADISKIGEKGVIARLEEAEFADPKLVSGKSRSLRRYYKLLKAAHAAFAGNDLRKAKEIYTKARDIYIDMEYSEKKEVHQELMKLYRKLTE